MRDSVSKVVAAYRAGGSGETRKRAAVGREASEYQMRHRPSKEGPSVYDLGSQDVEIPLPPDILVHPEWYTGHRNLLRTFWPSVLRAQGRPDAKVVIYRGLPASAPAEFNPGDWVTLSQDYARQHVKSNVPDGHVLSVTVPARTVVFAGDDLMEWGYWGPSVKGQSKVVVRGKTVAAGESPQRKNAAEVDKKDNGRPRGTFHGESSGKGWTYTEGYPFGIRTWSASIALSSKNDWKNLSVDRATENSPEFIKALKEIVREYPEILEYWVSFDGPYKAVRDVLSQSTQNLKPLPSLVYYHGTSEDVVPRILEDGLQSRGVTNVEPVFGVEFGAAPSREHAVYLTTQLGMAAAAAVSAGRKRKSTPVILEIKGGLREEYFEADEDSRKNTPQESLATLGSVAYTRSIHPHNIRIYSYLEKNGVWTQV